MSETSEHELDPAGDDDEGNPTDEELDVEGPNESAPGHHPDGDESEEAAGPSLPAE